MDFPHCAAFIVRSVNFLQCIQFLHANHDIKKCVHVCYCCLFACLLRNLRLRSKLTNIGTGRLFVFATEHGSQHKRLKRAVFCADILFSYALFLPQRS